MAALPVIADTYRCAVNWAVAGGQYAENVMHIRAPGKTSAEVATALDTHTAANMFLAIASAASAPSVSITPLDGTSATTEHALSNWLGTATGDYIPAASCLLTLYTGLRGRSHRGRIYLPFFAENRQTNGFFSDLSNVTATESAWASWFAGNVTDGFALVVASYKLSTAQTVETIVCQDAIATQRRRQGRNKP